jgi:hypothetical protein
MVTGAPSWRDAAFISTWQSRMASAEFAAFIGDCVPSSSSGYVAVGLTNVRVAAECLVARLFGPTVAIALFAAEGDPNMLPVGKPTLGSSNTVTAPWHRVLRDAVLQTEPPGPRLRYADSAMGSCSADCVFDAQR